MTIDRFKQFKLFLFMLLIAMVSVRFGYTCSSVPVTHHPVYLPYDQLRSAIKSLPPQALVTPGKILVKEQYLYISERHSGVHIIDNSDPENPLNIGFINVPGNVDLAIKGNTLYVDSYVDLVAIDVSNPESVQETGRLPDVYSYSALFDNGEYYWDESLDPAQGVVVDVETVDSGDVGSCDSYYEDSRHGCSLGGSGSGSANTSPDVPQSSTGGEGLAGSLARMQVNGDTLYLLSDSILKSISIATPTNPVLLGTTEAGWDVETIYIHNGYLLIGAQTGVRMYDLTNPDYPTYLSSFDHAWQCDPIVAEGDTAYVTLRGGVGCNGFANQLDILDISNIAAPELIKSYPMENPYGLGIDSNILFIADGYAGVKIFDVTDPHIIVKLKQFPDVEVRDIILNNKIAIVSGPDGIYQYDYSGLDDIKLTSSLSVQNE